MSLEPKHFYDFDNFRVDPDERVLLRDGKPLPLTPKAFHMLMVLIENHGHIVDKEKLMGEIWSDSFVEEGNLSVNARRLRKALADDASEPRFIETVPRRGYRFIADVKECVVDIAPKKELNENVPAPVQPAAAKWYLPIAAVLLLFTCAVIFYFGFARTSTGAENKSIAVLPVRPIDAANRDVIYEIGIAESLIHQLSSMKGFVVRPLSATRQYTDIAKDPLESGREQKVDYVLVSNYQFAGGKVRVTSQLLDVASGEVEDTYKTEKDAGDVFAMQDAIAREVGNLLLARFGTTSSGTTAKRGTNSEEAYRLYLRAKYLQEKRVLADSVKAIELLDEAIRFDPNYARAWAVKAFAHVIKTNSQRSVSLDLEYEKAIEAANKALELDENLSEAHGAVCDIKTTYEWDLSGAEKACKRAIELDPKSTIVRQTYARSLMTLGHFDEATAEAKAAIDLEPASLLNHRIYGCTFFYARRYDEAIVVFKRTIELDPNSGPPIYYWLVEALQIKGNDAETFDWFIKEQTLRKTDEETMQAYRAAYQTSGWQGVLTEIAERFNESDTGYFGAVYINTKLGRKDKAFEYLEKAYQRREWPFAYIKVDPRLDPLRDDPRFDELLRRVESR